MAWSYAAMFVLIASLAYLPGLTDDAGALFGLFRLDLYDNLLHLFSGLWAAAAAWRSARAATTYFQLFGPIYGFDGVMGLMFGQAYLDGGIFLYGPAPLPFATRFAANLPHIAIGGLAILIGYGLSRRYASRA